MTTWASARRSRSISRSAWMPSSSRPSPCSGCGRRTLSNRRTSASSVASRKIRCGCQPASRSAASPACSSEWNARARTSTTAAICRSLTPVSRTWLGELGHRRQQLGRQVVDDVPAAVLDDVGRRRPAGPAHPGDDEEVVRAAAAAAGRPRRARRQPWPAPSTRPAPSSSTTSPVARLTAGVVSAVEPNSAATTAASAGPMPGTSDELVDRGGPDPLHRAEPLEQRLAALLPQPGDAVEPARRHRLGAPLPVEGDREPVRLVAQPLQEVEALAGAGQHDRVLLARAPRPPRAASRARPRRRRRPRSPRAPAPRR